VIFESSDRRQTGVADFGIASPETLLVPLIPVIIRGLPM
jgi:hypothetical protein